MRSFAFLLLAGLVAVGAKAQPVFHDSKSPQISFAVSEIRRNLGANGNAVSEPAIRTLPADRSALRFVIAEGTAECSSLAKTLGAAPLKDTRPQSYAIRRQEKNGPGDMLFGTGGSSPYI